MPEWKNTVQDTAALEYCILSVDEAYRITLPKGFCKQVGWIVGDKPHNGWLLLGDSGRCRLLSVAEVESEPRLHSLRDRIAAELDTPSADPLEFQEEASAALPLRLVGVEIRPRGPGWRLALPRVVGAIMQIRPKDGEVAALLLQGHIEIWTIETLRSSVSRPLTQII